MLPRNNSLYPKINMNKRCHGKDVTPFGAFGEGEEIIFTLTLPRRLGASGVVFRLIRDGESFFDRPFSFVERDGGDDLYNITLKGLEKGLYFYEILFLRGSDTLFSDSVNNLDFQLSKSEGRSFTLLIYETAFHTPSFLKGGVIYHIFPDRFRRGKGDVTYHGIINDDWERGIPPYAKRAGDPLDNSVFFGGNLWGVIEKLDYLVSLGVTVIYLSPIFESVSNHRYDTGDYEKIDSLLGGVEAFDKLVSECHKRDIKVILDGVFNHTGDDSRYFNKKGSYSELGAYQGEKSHYFNWYNFKSFPDEYESWWGIDIMPRLCHENKECRRYFTENIARKWLRRGADGWRLDVADELSDTFLFDFNRTVKNEGQFAIIGEVWENAVTKISYGKRRKYFWGSQLDSVMNYPLRNAVIALLLDHDTETFYNTLTELYSSYPPEVSHSLMNIISTHDTERMLSVLGNPTLSGEIDNDRLASSKLTPEERQEAIKKMKIASVIQYTVFGTPSLYYGDEAGMEGYRDPFCRLPYPWGREEKSLIEHYKMLGALRATHPALTDGDFDFLEHNESTVSYRRKKGNDAVTVKVDIQRTEYELNA